MDLRVYTLYRVSTVGQVEKDDIPMQKQCCREFAQRQGWLILEEFSEKGISGYKKSAKDRDAIQQIQQAAVQKKFDILLVYMFDRLGRRDDETPFVVEWFCKQGIQVWSVMEGQQRFDSHVDKLMNYIRYWQASGESLKTSIRTKTRLGQLTEEGLYTGGSIAFGYKRVDNGRKNKRDKPVFDLAVDENEAEIVRLIFHKYVNEGYGALRISRFLVEQNIMGREGKNIPNTSIVRMIKNPIYTGLLVNGEAECDCPQLRIIEPALFDRAQEIRTKRVQPHSDIPLNSRGKSLLVGRVYCGHCGNRLTLTTCGRRQHTIDGKIIYEPRFRYQCHYKVRHPGQCDGQSGYGVSKLDAIVDEVIRRKFLELKATSKAELLASQNQKIIAQCEAKIRQLQEACESKEKELADLRAETIKVIRGQSKLSSTLLNSLVYEAEAEFEARERQLADARAELQSHQASLDPVIQEYDQIMTWADLYDHCSVAAKKMIILQFIKSIHVHKNYDVDIEFNISFAEFQNFKSKSTFVGEEYMTEAHKMGNYSELRSSEPWTPDRLLAN